MNKTEELELHLKNWRESRKSSLIRSLHQALDCYEAIIDKKKCIQCSLSEICMKFNKLLES